MAMVLSIPYSGFPSDVEPHDDENDAPPSIGSPTASEDDSDNDALMDSVAQQNEQQQQQDDDGMSPSSSSSDLVSSNGPLNTTLSEEEEEEPHVFTDQSPDDYWDFPSNNDSSTNEYVLVPHEEEEVCDTTMDIDDSDENDPLFGNLFQAEPQEPQKYGGLSNLGNTCYMASALQMLASLNGSFVQDLRAQLPPVVVEAEDDHNNNSEDMTSTTTPPLNLRQALLEVLDGLAKGETVRPEAFKRCIDDRTGLFLGYRQQDAHEFLTKLLDLLDEDYKKKDEPEEVNAEEEAVANEDAMDTTKAKVDDDEPFMIEETSSEEEEQAEASGIDALAGLFENEDDASIVIGEISEDDESASKKPRLQEQQEESSEEAGSADRPDVANNEDQVVRRSSSLINLGFGDIEELLHGDNAGKSSSAPTANFMMDRREGEPKCKLVGGRMNTSQAELTRYDESKHIDLEAMAANNDSASKLEVVDEMSECSVDEAKSPVESNFTTEVCVSLTCESCKFRRSHTETFLHLSLELGADSCSSVDECVRKFFAPEKREIKCEKCFHSSALQTTEITKLPKALLFHPKRFIVDVSPDYTSISYRKNQSPVAFQESIPLEDGGDGLFEEFLAPDVVVSKGSSYSIRSVVNHIGASASCGHYTNDSKREYDGDVGEEVREWTRFNDSYVSKISSTEAVRDSANTAYMIMYELEE